MRFSLSLLLFAVAFASPTPVTFPGQPSAPNFNSFAGHVNVDQAAGRDLFYVFSESQRDPANDPVVLWLVRRHSDGYRGVETV